MRVLELSGYDVVLGMDWLKGHSPMTVDWVAKTLKIPHNNSLAQLVGMQSSTGCPLPLNAMTVEQLCKSYAANDIWALVVVEVDTATGSATVSTKIPQELAALLTEFSDVFATLDSLLPHRVYDHAISLENAHTPVNCIPYRYSPFQKDEIEKQVAEMITVGVIVPTMSPYASPVLLVKKKDGEWRFCVEYHRLNSSTIKNKFPHPVVDELLDELAAAQFFSKLDLLAGYRQIRMHEADEEKTAFKTHRGHFQHLSMLNELHFL